MRAPRRATSRDFVPAQAIAAAGWPIQTSQHVHQGGLAKPRGPHQRHVLSFLDRQICGAQGLDLDLAQVIDLPHIAYLDQRQNEYPRLRIPERYAHGLKLPRQKDN